MRLYLTPSPEAGAAQSVQPGGSAAFPQWLYYRKQAGYRHNLRTGRYQGSAPLCPEKAQDGQRPGAR